MVIEKHFLTAAETLPDVPLNQTTINKMPVWGVESLRMHGVA